MKKSFFSAYVSFANNDLACGSKNATSIQVITSENELCLKDYLIFYLFYYYNIICTIKIRLL